jgi:hypothetical protein
MSKAVPFTILGHFNEQPIRAPSGRPSPAPTAAVTRTSRPPIHLVAGASWDDDDVIGADGSHGHYSPADEQEGSAIGAVGPNWCTASLSALGQLLLPEISQRKVGRQEAGGHPSDGIAECQTGTEIAVHLIIIIIIIFMIAIIIWQPFSRFFFLILRFSPFVSAASPGERNGIDPGTFSFVAAARECPSRAHCHDGRRCKWPSVRQPPKTNDQQPLDACHDSLSCSRWAALLSLNHFICQSDENAN